MKTYEGTLHYDDERERYMIAFDHSAKRPIWLHCGDCLDVFSGGEWKESSIEAAVNNDWYLTGTGLKRDLDGLRVRWYEDE